MPTQGRVGTADFREKTPASSLPAWHNLAQNKLFLSWYAGRVNGEITAYCLAFNIFNQTKMKERH
jgi:hypothetical protein